MSKYAARNSTGLFGRSFTSACIPCSRMGTSAGLQVLAYGHRVDVDLGRDVDRGLLRGGGRLRVVVAGILGGGKGLILFGLHRGCVIEEGWDGVSGPPGRTKTECASNGHPPAGGPRACRVPAAGSGVDRGVGATGLGCGATARTVRFGHRFRVASGRLLRCGPPAPVQNQTFRPPFANSARTRRRLSNYAGAGQPAGRPHPRRPPPRAALVPPTRRVALSPRGAE